MRVQEAACEVCAGAATLRQLRRSGAGVEVARTARTLEEIRRRGCRAQVRRMHRCERSSRLGAEFSKYPAGQRALHVSCESRLHVL